MQTLGPCHACKTPGVRPIYSDRSWTKTGAGQELEHIFDLLSESTNNDMPKLESLFPRDDDGRVLKVEYEWIDDRRVRLKLSRAVSASLPAEPVFPTGKPLNKMSIADLQTYATEKGIAFDEAWTKDQLLTAIKKSANG